MHGHRASWGPDSTTVHLGTAVAGATNSRPKDRPLYSSDYVQLLTGNPSWRVLRAWHSRVRCLSMPRTHAKRLERITPDIESLKSAHTTLLKAMSSPSDCATTATTLLHSAMTFAAAHALVQRVFGCLATLVLYRSAGSAMCYPLPLPANHAQENTVACTVRAAAMSASIYIGFMVASQRPVVTPTVASRSQWSRTH